MVELLSRAVDFDNLASFRFALPFVHLTLPNDRMAMPFIVSAAL